MEPKRLQANQRIKLKYCFDALGWAVCLQEKRWYGWKTLAWTYPSVHPDSTCDYIVEYLFWKHNRENPLTKSEKTLGKELMTKCNYN